MGSTSSNIAAMMLGPDMIRQRQQLKQNQQQMDIQQQQARQHAEANDEQIAQLAGQGIVKYVNGGAVMDAMNPPSDDQIDAGQTDPMPAYRKADPTRTTTHTDAQGNKIQLEWTTAAEQAKLRSLRTAQDATDRMNAETQPDVLAGQQKIADSQAMGTAQAGADVRAKYSIPASQMYTPEALQRMGISGDYRALPSELANLANRAVPSFVRGDTATTIQDSKNDAAGQRAQLRVDSQKSIADARNQAAADYQAEQLRHQDEWNQARADIAKQKEAGLSSRNASRVTTDEKLHGQWSDQAFKEEQAQIAAQGLLEEHDEPGVMGIGTNKVQATPDNQEFVNPFTGKKAVMNYGQRLALKNGLDLSQKRSTDLRSRVDEISQRYGLDKYAQAPAAQGTAPTTTTAPSPVRNGAPPAIPAATMPPAARGAQSTDTVRVQTGDGRVGTIPRANLNAAKKKDPKLTLLPDAGSATGR